MKGLYYVACDSETFLFIGIIVYYGQLIDAEKYYPTKSRKKMLLEEHGQLQKNNVSLMH